MTIKRLSQYRHLRRELEQLGDEIERLQRRRLTDTVQASAGPGGALREITVQGDPAQVKKLKTRLRRQERRLLREQEAIEAFVDRVEDSRIRQIIELRFLQGTRLLSWQAVAFRMGWRDEGSPRKLLNKFFEQSDLSEFSVLK